MKILFVHILTKTRRKCANGLNIYTLLVAIIYGNATRFVEFFLVRFLRPACFLPYLEQDGDSRLQLPKEQTDSSKVSTWDEQRTMSKSGQN